MSKNEGRTEAPTPRRLAEARKEGKVARTPDIGGWLSVLVVAMLAPHLVRIASERTHEMIARSARIAEDPTTNAALAFLRDAGVVALVGAVSIGLVALLAGVLSGVSQGGMHLASKAAKPTWKRLNPVAGAKRLLGPQAWWECVKILIKTSIVAFVVWRAIQHILPLVQGLVPMSVTLELAGAEVIALLRNVALAGIVTGLADYAVQRRRIGKENKMTLQEVKDEHKQSEGDPLLKSAIRSRQLSASRGRQMTDVAHADVVLVNPTHVAVGLRYDSDRGAPRVVAKGAGVVAARLREKATEHDVAIVEDVPLARALFAACELGDEIPAELYTAVAQVLAFVVGRRSRGASGGRHRSPRHELDVPDVPRAGRRRRRVEAAA